MAKEVALLYLIFSKSGPGIEVICANNKVIQEIKVVEREILDEVTTLRNLIPDRLKTLKIRLGVYSDAGTLRTTLRYPIRLRKHIQKTYGDIICNRLNEIFVKIFRNLVFQEEM